MTLSFTTHKLPRLPLQQFFQARNMVSADPFLSLLDSDESGRLSFSSEFLDESNFITICPDPRAEMEERERGRGGRSNVADFEFLSGSLAPSMISADELMSEGKLLPFWQIHHAEKLKKISLKPDGGGDEAEAKIEPRNKEERMTWFVDEDPSPRPPKCTVLWKELLKLKKQRPSTLSASSSSSSSSSSYSSSTRTSANEIRGGDERKEGVKSSENKGSKKMKKLGQERTRSIRIRPVLNVPICMQAKNVALPPLFSLRKARVER